MKAQWNLIIASLANTVVSWLLFSAILSIINHASFGETLLGPYAILMAVTAGISSYLGFYRRQIKANNEIN